MFQHIVITLVAPPLLLVGMPGWLTRWMLRPRRLGDAVRTLARPFCAGILFNVVFALSHWPAVVNFTLEHDASHFFAHLLLFASGLLMWFPVVNRLPEFPTMSAPLRMLYLFLQTVLPTVPASFLTFAQGPVYSFYARVPHALGFDVVEDQQLAAALMKVGLLPEVMSRVLGADRAGREGGGPGRGSRRGIARRDPGRRRRGAHVGRRRPGPTAGRLRASGARPLTAARAARGDPDQVPGSL